jgi:hypothetical protein
VHMVKGSVLMIDGMVGDDLEPGKEEADLEEAEVES